MLRRFFWVTILLLLFSSSLMAEEPSLPLEPIIVSKGKLHFTHAYALSPEFNKVPASSFIDALPLISPLDVQSRSPGGIQADFSLRASGYHGVLCALDGQRFNDVQTGHHHIDIPLTEADIQVIEVIPGAGSSLFGPDAMGGVVNFVSRKPLKKEGVIQITGGSYQTHSELCSVTEKRGPVGVRLSVENRESAGYGEDTDSKKFTTTLYSVFEGEGVQGHVNVGYQEKEFGAYDFYTPASGYLSQEWTKTYLLNTGVDWEVNGVLLKPHFLWRRHFDKFALDKTLQRSRYLNHHRTDMYTPSLYVQFPDGLFGKIGMGIEYGEESITSSNLGKHSRIYQSIFLDEEKEITTQLGIGSSVRMDDFDDFGQVFTGSVNLRYTFLPHNAFLLGASRSIRVPTFTELYYADPTTVGDAGLSEEKGFTYQVGYEHAADTLSAGVTTFLRREKDIIDWVKTTPSQATWQASNLNEADVWGWESYLKTRLNERLQFTTQYTYNNKERDKQGYQYKYGQNYYRHLLSMVFNLSFSAFTEDVSFVYKKRPSRRGWWLVNSRLAKPLNKNVQVFLAITNLFNVEYQEIEGIAQPGRSFQIGCRWEW
jgi:iron complex outermembrane receptor protein